MCRRARCGNVAISYRKHCKIAKNFISLPPMRAPPCLKGGGKCKALAGGIQQGGIRGRRLIKNKIFHLFGFIYTLKGLFLISETAPFLIIRLHISGFQSEGVRLSSQYPIYEVSHSHVKSSFQHDYHMAFRHNGEA